MKNIIAVDPGKGGGVAWRNADDVTCEPMPETEGDIIDLWTRLNVSKDVTIVLEHNSGYAGRNTPASTAFTMAKYYWPWIYLPMAFERRVEIVKPQAWIKVLELGKKPPKVGLTQSQKGKIDREWKAKLKSEAQRLFPGVEGITLKTCDALLILEYAMRREGAKR